MPQSASEPLEHAAADSSERVHEPQTPGASVLRPPTEARGPRKPRRWPLVLGGVLFVCGGGITALVLSGRVQMLGLGAPSRTAGVLDHLTASIVQSKLRQQGFEVHEHTRSHQQGALEFVSFEFARDAHKGYAQLYRWVDDEAAARGMAGLPASDDTTAVTTSGVVALVIVDRDGDPKALMHAIIE
jgi:hypothetical protein